MKSSSTSERLKQIMNERSLRQVDILEAAKPFCEKYGVKLAKNDLSQYVSGKVEPGQEKLTVLGLALNVSETWLMGYDVPMERDETIKKDPATNGEVSPEKRERLDLIDRLSDDQCGKLSNIIKEAIKLL